MGGCVATDRITVDGERVGSVVRQAPVDKADSGWLFLAGDESQDYMDEKSNLAVYDVNTIANYDRDIIPYLYALPGQRFDREPGTHVFHEAPDSRPDEAAAGLPPGVRVVQGQYRMTARWSIALPTPFRHRIEDGSLVLWRAGLTLWIGVYSGTGSIEERAGELRAAMSPAACDVRTDDRAGLVQISYRLREDTTDAGTPSMNAFVVGTNEYVHLGVYLDRESDVAAARDVIASVCQE